jgi:hypothetical protein
MTEKLICPFCGSRDIRFTNHGEAKPRFGDSHSDALHYGDEIWSTCCYLCGATFPNMYSREKLEEKWRARPTPEPAQGNVEIVALALARHWAKRFRGNEREFAVYLDDNLREDARVAIAALPARPVDVGAVVGEFSAYTEAVARLFRSVLAAMDTGRNEPLEIARDSIRKFLDAQAIRERGLEVGR